MTGPTIERSARTPTGTRRPWPRILLTGLTLWLLTVAAIFLTGDPNLIPPWYCSAASWCR